MLVVLTNVTFRAAPSLCTLWLETDSIHGVTGPIKTKQSTVKSTLSPICTFWTSCVKEAKKCNSKLVYIKLSFKESLARFLTNPSIGT